MRKVAIGILTVGLIIGGNVAIWAGLNRPETTKSWTGGAINGVSFSPYSANESPMEDRHPSAEEITADLRVVAPMVKSVRTYSSTDGLDRVAPLARREGLAVTAGAWLDTRTARNATEIASVIKVANANRNVVRIMVGNEAVLRADVTVPQLVDYIRQVKRKVTQPVSTAEPWHVWLAHPELVRSVDFIAVHILPYWEGVPADQAVPYIQRRYDELAAAYPNKKIVISEVGWPSDGRMRQGAVPTLTAQGVFLRDFLNLAREQGWDYYIMEAFDQPWKRTIEGSVGAYWGIWDADRQPKFPMAGAISEVADWPKLAAASSLLAFIPLAIFLFAARNLKFMGHVFYGSLILVASNVIVWTAYYATTQYLTAPMMAVWGALSLGLLFLLTMLMSEGLEITEALWTRRFRRHFTPYQLAPEQAAARHWPKVSLHLPLYNEPPEMVQKTLDALARLDYPDFEVLVIDNNTKDPAVWQPVETYCQNLGPRFRFFHLPVCPGFKAGALNFGIEQTAKDVAIVGVIDSDYIVSPDWLKSTIPYFDETAVGFVQAPQDHHDWHDDAFKEMINWEYAGFFSIGMVLRNERDAIIQHGTMTLIRKEAMDRDGNWATWCICEDAEMGLRLMHGGWKSVYINHPFGRGVTPDSFGGYKSQRFRWAYGAIQILRRHWRWMLPGKAQKLSAGQRYHFVTGWAPWFADALNLLFAVSAIAWSAGLVVAPKIFDFPVTLFVVPTIAIFGFKIAYTLSLYRAKVPCTFRQSVGAALAGLALTFTVGKAVILGLFTKSKPFMRTPKMENKPALLRGFAQAWEETLLTIGLWASAAAVALTYGNDDRTAYIWAAVLVVQSVPFFAALIVSMVSAMPTLDLVARLRRRALRPAGE